MSNMFDLGGNTTSWNYSDPGREGYSEQLAGTIVEITAVQSRDPQTKKLEFYDDSGRPKVKYRINVCDAAGNEFTWMISSAKSSNAVVAIKNAIVQNNPKNHHPKLSDLLGKMVTISTAAGSYGRGRPRPWKVTVIGEGDQELVRGVFDEVTQNQPQALNYEEQAKQAAAVAEMLQQKQDARQAPAPAPVPAVPDLTPYAAEDIPF